MVKLIHASDVHLGITYAGIGKNHREIARELKQETTFILLEVLLKQLN